MFLHGGICHIVFNMLALWMFGAELERTWGTRYFLKFYFVTGIGAGLLTVLFSLLPFGFARQLQGVNIIGASGAIYGLLLAYAMYFPERPILLIVFWVPARLCVTILGAIAVFASLTDADGVSAASTVWASFMAGLAIGSLAAGTIGDRVRHPLRWMGVIEILIGATAVSTLTVFHGLLRLYVSLYPSLPHSLAALTARSQRRKLRSTARGVRRRVGRAARFCGFGARPDRRPTARRVFSQSCARS